MDTLYLKVATRQFDCDENSRAWRSTNVAFMAKTDHFGGFDATLKLQKHLKRFSLPVK